MKKLFALTLALLMIFAVCSCNGAKTPEETSTAPQDSQTTTTQVPSTTNEEETTRAPWKPPVITDEDTTDENGDPGPAPEPLAAPTTFPDGSLMEIVPISDGKMNKEDGVAIGKWATELTDKTTCIFDGGKTVKASDYMGFLVKVTTDNGNGVYMRFRIKVKTSEGTEDANIEIKGNNRTIGWYREGEWKDFQGAASNWVTPNSTGGWVYLPFSVLTEISESAEITDIQVYSSNGSNRIGVFSDWSFVKPGNDDPKKLADGTPIVLERISDGTMIVDGTADASAYGTAFAGTTKSIFDGGAKVKVSDYKGVMMKVETVAETGFYGLYLHLLAKLSDGTDIEINSSERTYEWFDGKTWVTVTGPALNWRTPNVESCWVYVPFPLNEITTDEILDFGIFSAKSSNRKGSFSELSFVKATGEGGTPVDNRPVVPELAAPTKLADNTAITLVPVSDGILSSAGVSVSGRASEMPYQTMSIFKDGATINPANYKGMMIKVATSTETHMGLYMRFYFKLTDGTEIQVKALGKPIQFYNGTTWQTYESGETATNWVTPSEEVGYLYVEFPFPEITVTEIADIRIYSNGSTNRLGTFSDWCLVEAVTQ